MLAVARKDSRTFCAAKLEGWKARYELTLHDGSDLKVLGDRRKRINALEIALRRNLLQAKTLDDEEED